MNHIRSLILTSIIFLALPATAQEKTLLNDSAASQLSQQLVHSMYNWEFDSAKQLTAQLEKWYPDHPVIAFSRAMISYWEYFPTQPGSQELQQQHTWLLKTINDADLRLKQNPKDQEGAFFKMVAKGVLVRYYHEHGQLMQAIREAKDMYPIMLRGLDQAEEFVENKTAAGIYNYYRAYYPTQYPELKPFAIFFRKGSTQKGLRQLHEAVEQTVFSRPEALYYLSYIYNWYERKPQESHKYIRQLRNDYPNNLTFVELEAKSMLQTGQFQAARQPVDLLLSSQASPYFKMLGHTYDGIIKEQYHQDLESAFHAYQQAEAILPQYQRYNYQVAPFIYMGYSYYYQSKGDTKQASYYQEKAIASDNQGLLPVKMDR